MKRTFTSISTFVLGLLLSVTAVAQNPREATSTHSANCIRQEKLNVPMPAADQLERNMAAISITVPENIVAGKKGSVKVVVQNLGTAAAERYFVLLYANGNQCGAVSRLKNLPSMEKDTITFKLPVAINEQAASLQVKAMIVYDGDMQLNDNETETKTVGIVPSPYGRINDLKAEEAGNYKVILTWGNPVVPESGKGADDDITEYVIYRDGAKIARVTGDKHTYTNTRVTGGHVYNVTVIYTSKDGETNESGFSNDAPIGAASIHATEKMSSSFDVTTLNGVRIRTGAKTLDGLKRGIYIINGKKHVVR